MTKNELGIKILLIAPILILALFVKFGIRSISPLSRFESPITFEFVENRELDNDSTTHEIYMSFVIDGNDASKELDLVLEVSSVYRLFFDQQEIGYNGDLDANDSDTSKGKYFRKFRIPQHFTESGTHSVMIRLAPDLDRSKLSIGDIYLGRSDVIFQQSMIVASIISALAGICLIIAIYYLVIYFIAFRKITFLLFSILCFSIVGVILLEYLNLWHSYSIRFHHIRLLLISFFSTLTYALLILYLIERFSYHAWVFRIMTAVLIVLMLCWLFVSSEDLKVMIIAIASIATSIIICTIAIWNRQEGSWYGFLGVLSLAITVPYYSFSIFLGFALLIFYNLISLSYKLRQEQEKHRQSLMRSTYFELELLKQKIKPHFLLNTLTSIISWIRVQPDTGIKMIEALGREFLLLDEIAQKSLVPISSEVNLCQAHIDIMQIRKDITCKLEVSLLEEDWMIPPGILHTLIENGITHQSVGKERIVFKISGRMNKGKIIEVSTPYHGDKKIINNAKEGNGYKYVKARLQEAFPDNWKLNYFTKNGIYVNQIVIYT